jgi:hypothetical protein
MLNMQTQPTLGGGIFVFAFGYEMSRFSLSGYIFLSSCLGYADPIKRLISIFHANSAIVTQNPLMISVGGYPVQGYLQGLSGSITAEGIGKFQMELQANPPDSRFLNS